MRAWRRRSGRAPPLKIRTLGISRWCFTSYLIHGDAGLVVVDPGWAGIVDDLTPIIQARGGALSIVTATHGHPNHLGGAPRLAARYDDAIHLGATTVDDISGATTPRSPPLRDVARTWPILSGRPFDIRAVIGHLHAGATAGFGGPLGMLWPGPAPAGALHDRQELPGVVAWTVLASPGHTDVHVCFWHEGSGTLLAGDAIFTAAGRPRFAPDIVDQHAAGATRGTTGSPGRDRTTRGRSGRTSERQRCHARPGV